LCFQYTYVKKRSRITVYTQLYLTCKNSYMLQLYICTHHQAGYRTLNKRTIKYNTIKLWGRDLVFTSMYNYKKRSLKTFYNYTILHILPATFVYFHVLLCSFVQLYIDVKTGSRPHNCIVLYLLHSILQGSVSSLMMATYV